MTVLFGLRFDFRNPGFRRTTAGERYLAALDIAEWADRLALLTGTFTQDVDFGSNDWRARADKVDSIKLFETLFGPQYFPRNLRVVEEVKGLAARYGRSLPQLALRWAISNPVVSTALLGCRTVAEVEDNVGALGWSIAEEDLGEIDAIFARHGVNPVPDRWVEDA